MEEEGHRERAMELSSKRTPVGRVEDTGRARISSTVLLPTRSLFFNISPLDRRMPLQYDAEFAQLAEPILRQAQGFTKPKLHDVEGRRSMLANMFPQITKTPVIPDDIEQIVHHARAPDQHEIAIYHIRKKSSAEQSAGPAVVHMHGGGYIALTATVGIEMMASYVAQTGVPVLTIDYRVAPENPYPTPVEDCWTALQWIRSHADTLSIDVGRMAVMGESAGGGLAAAVALLARDRGLSPPLAKQILIYPMMDDRTQSNHAGELVTWDENDNRTGWAAYIGQDVGSDRVPPYAAAARTASVEGLPPLYLDCGQLEIFVHESLEYVRRFVAANIPTECHIFEGLPHGFEGLAPTSTAVQRAMDHRARAMTSI